MFVVYVYGIVWEYVGSGLFPLLYECEGANDEVVFVVVVCCSLFDEG